MAHDSAFLTRSWEVLVLLLRNHTLSCEDLEESLFPVG